MLENLTLRRLLHQIDVLMGADHTPKRLVVGVERLPELLEGLPSEAWTLHVLGFKVELSEDRSASATIAP